MPMRTCPRVHPLRACSSAQVRTDMSSRSPARAPSRAGTKPAGRSRPARSTPAPPLPRCPPTARAALAVPDGARLIDLADGTARPLTGHRGSVTALAFSPDGQLLATGAADRTARLYRTGDPSATARELGPHSGSVTVLAFAPDGQRLATGSWDRRVRIWSLEGGAPRILEEHSGPVRALAWRPDGAALATASDDATVRVWPLDGRDEPVVLTGHQGPVRALAWSPAGPHLASAGDDGQLRLWTADFAPATLKARLRAASPVCFGAPARPAPRRTSDARRGQRDRVPERARISRVTSSSPDGRNAEPSSATRAPWPHASPSLAAPAACGPEPAPAATARSRKPGREAEVVHPTATRPRRRLAKHRRNKNPSHRVPAHRWLGTRARTRPVMHPAPAC
ncbi:WD40 repeat domain-containing protein [Nannocystis pusilla]|uniref:WD40 repeat domain-containing protein n=1 Tax=Nannocystis pusilla TaxID=889268 RepID=UPI003B82E4CA